MKIFKDIKAKKVNFVDKQNVVVGFDYNRICGEEIDWFLSKNEADINRSNEFIPNDLGNYLFDINYYRESYIEGVWNVSFMLSKPETNEVIYLHLTNTHNGYYTHGFTMTYHHGVKVREGKI